MSPHNQPSEAPVSSFERDMIAAGMLPAVAAELERRIEVVEHDERDDASRLPFTPRELAVYVAVTVLAVLIGVLLVAL